MINGALNDVISKKRKKCVLLVTGDSGIGKTLLIKEVLICFRKYLPPEGVTKFPNFRLRRVVSESGQDVESCLWCVH